MAPARTLALVLASGVLAPGVLALALLQSAQLRADDLPAPPVEAPPAPPAAKGGPTEAERVEIQALVDSLREEAARIRGLAWKQRVPSDLITRTQMRADFLESLEEEYPLVRRERDKAILRRTGMLGPDEDYVDLSMEFMEAAVGGFYDPKRKHLRIVAGMKAKEQQPVILHELIHALEDQYLDLQARSKPLEDDSDRLFAEQCVVEGSAEHASTIFQRAHPEIAAAFQLAQQDPVAAGPQLKAMQKVPAWMFVPTMMHYSKGPAFVARQVRGGTYAERIQALYAAPPVSQEQVLHPTRWFGPKQDWPQRLAPGGDLAQAAGEGWSLYHTLTQGELDLALYLDFFLGGLKGRFNFVGQTPTAAASSAARGWDGGVAWVLKKDGLPLVGVEAWAFDSAADAWEAGEMLGQAAEKAAGSAWASKGWTKEGAGAVPAKATLDYVNQHGLSRTLVEGTRILRVDGAPLAVLEALWPVVLQTTFTKDARDTWDPAEENAALAAAGFLDQARGVGLTVPNASWTVRAGGTSRNAIATVTEATRKIEITLNAMPGEMPLEIVALAAAKDLVARFPDYTGNPDGDTVVGGFEGLCVPLGVAIDGRYGALVLAAGAKRTFFLIILGPSKEVLDAARSELDQLLASIVARE